jgi:hypothetical protein
LPFSSTSPWNTPANPNAQLEATNSPANQSLHADGAGTVNSGSWSIAVYTATSSDPLNTISTPSGTVQYQIPAGATPAIGSDAEMDVVTPDHQWVDECWDMQRTSTTTWTCGYHVHTSLTGSGVNGGIRAAGVSSFGGLIRTSELQNLSIPHALAIALAGNQLKLGYIAPATSQDGDAAGSYTGQVPMGSFMVIPSTVNLNTLGLNPQGLAVAQALQTYGGYVTDRAGGFTLYAETAAEGTAVNAIRNDMSIIESNLRIVSP